MSQTEPIRLLHYGLGPIGLGVVRHVADRSDMVSVAGVDIRPEVVGKDVGELAGLGRDLGAAVAAAAGDALGGAQVAIVCTSSHLSDVEPQIMALVQAGLNVVSTCEELSYPFWHHPEESRRIDDAAKRNGVTVLGTGVNPGFVMDLLPVVASGVCLRVDSVYVRRVVDAGTRRGPLQAKVGAGMSVEEFRAGVQAGRLGHKGFVESVAMIADALGLGVDTISENVQPKLLDRSFGPWTTGQVAGIDQTATGLRAGEAVVSLRLLMYVNADDPRDRIVLRGVPEVRWTLEGGTPGDQATAAITVNTIRRVMSAPPGLTSMKDLPPAHWSKG